MRKMAARSLKGMLSHSGLAARAATMAASTIAGVDVGNVERSCAWSWGIGWDDVGPAAGTCARQRGSGGTNARTACPPIKAGTAKGAAAVMAASSFSSATRSGELVE